VAIPSFNIGDLVVCKYSMEVVHFPVYELEKYQQVHIGLIIEIRKDYVFLFDKSTAYDVKCFDNVIRTFSCWEMQILSSIEKKP
jgi:hypothetical protein